MYQSYLFQTQPMYLGACTYARIEKLTCTAHSSALHERILLKFKILANYISKTQNVKTTLHKK